MRWASGAVTTDLISAVCGLNLFEPFRSRTEVRTTGHGRHKCGSGSPGILPGVVLLVIVSSPVYAQAWLFPKGQGSVGLGYQYVFVRDHYFSMGETEDVGHIPSHAMSLDLDYSLTQKMAIRLAIPFAAAKYAGGRPHQLPADDGGYHSGFQDFSMDVRYNLAKRAAMLTPFFKVVIPSNNYTYFAHSAIGRNLREYHIGTNFGRRLSFIAPRAYLQVRYSFAFVEQVLGIAPNRSNAEGQLGYFLSKRLSLLGQSQWMHAHAGVDHLYNVFHSGLPDNIWVHHDQIGKMDLLVVGGGASYQVNRSMAVFVSSGRAVHGRNTHAPAIVLTAGISRTFGGDHPGISAARASINPEPHKALVCTCMKTK